MALFDLTDAGGISASSRWLRSVSDDTTGRRRDIRSCTPAGVPAGFLDLMTGRCRFAQPPATRFDASGIILLWDVSFLTATSIYKFLILNIRQRLTNKTMKPEKDSTVVSRQRAFLISLNSKPKRLFNSILNHQDIAVLTDS